MQSCSRESVLRALVEKTARTSERCRHLEDCTQRIETKLDDITRRIERKFEEIDRVLNGRLGVPGLVTRVWIMTLLVSTLGSLGFGVLLYVLQRQSLTTWLGG